jgi:hypothetical protein
MLHRRCRSLPREHLRKGQAGETAAGIPQKLTS